MKAQTGRNAKGEGVVMSCYQPKTGAPCGCKRGVQRDNCPRCEGTGYAIDFREIHAERRRREAAKVAQAAQVPQ